MNLATRYISIALIDPPPHPTRFDITPESVMELADTIREHGLIHPILVRATGDRFEVVAGHRRYLAHRLIGLSDARCTITASDNDLLATQQQIIENMHRSDLSPIEEAAAMADMMVACERDVVRVAQLVRRRPDWVESRLDLLAYPDDLQQLVHAGALPIASARALALCTDDHHRKYLSDYAINAGASSAIVRMWIHDWQQQQIVTPGAPPVQLPPMIAGQKITVMMPCLTCGEQHDHGTMIIVRLCRPCHAEIANAPGSVPHEISTRSNNQPTQEV